MIKKIKITLLFLIIIFFSTFIFLHLNPLTNWYEGNIENLYFIYNSILSSLKIKPVVIDYPGTPSFIINGFVYNIFLGEFSGISEISDQYRIDNYLNYTLKINKYIQLIYLSLYFIFVFKILNEFNSNNIYPNFLLTVAIIFSPPMIENFQLSRIENDALFFLSVGVYFFIRFIKTNSLKNFFLFNIFFLLMLLTKVLYVFTVYLLIIILYFFKKEKILNYFNKLNFFSALILINIFLFFSLYGIQIFLNKFYFISIIFSLVTYGLVISSLIYSFLILKIDLKKLFLCSLCSLIAIIFLFYLTNSNFSHLYYVLFPFDLLKQHLRGAYSLDANFIEQIILIIKKIYLNFSEFKIHFYEVFILISFLITFLINFKLNLINFFLVLLYFLFKIIFNIKYYLYYDSITFLLLTILFSNLFTKNTRLRYFLTFCVLIISIYSTHKIIIYDDLQINNKAKSNEIIKNFCRYSLITEEEFNKLDVDDPENYALYHTKNLMTYKNIKQICFNRL